MPYAPCRRHRRSIRLRGYDAAQPGAYSITIATAGRKCLFGEVVDVAMDLGQLGTVAADC